VTTIFLETYIAVAVTNLVVILIGIAVNDWMFSNFRRQVESQLDATLKHLEEK
jgi:hypothetical protein